MGRITRKSQRLMSYRELETMFRINDLTKTRCAQELMAESKKEGKIEVIPKLRIKGFSVEEIAEILEL